MVPDSLSAVERLAEGQFAQHMAENYPRHVATLKRQLTLRVKSLAEAVVIEMRDPACPCRQKLSSMLDAMLPPGRLIDLQQSEGRITAFIEGEYAQLAQQRGKVITGRGQAVHPAQWKRHLLRILPVECSNGKAWFPSSVIWQDIRHVSA